jgi:hypothetical protein
MPHCSIWERASNRSSVCYAVPRRRSSTLPISCALHQNGLTSAATAISVA